MDINDKEIFDRLCKNFFDELPRSATKLPAAGGDRIYWRLRLKSFSVLGVIADNLKESKAYVELSQSFIKSKQAKAGEFHIPEVFAYTSDYSHYLVADVGDSSLFDMLGRQNSEELVKRTVEQLTALQTVSERDWRTHVAYDRFTRRLAKWDLNYFKYEFLKNADVSFDENLLEDDFDLLATNLLNIPRHQWGFMMRDCQSRNVMISTREGNVPYFIDFQGGRRGPLLYDAVSLLWQAKAGFSPEFRNEMLRYYAESLSRRRWMDPGEILKYVGIVALFRTLQVLGAYGYRGLVQKRAHFIRSIPGALANLKWLMIEGELDCYPEIRNITRALVETSRFASIEDLGNKLLIKVFSFSYKRGYPEDLTGNGGGFMFDCRGMHNPGRYDEYKELTGRDLPVMVFLKEKGEADIFADKAVDMVVPTIERYIERGFTSLQIGFGCTGGRHRSVYCAEKVAHELANRFPEAEIILIHREQNIREELGKR